MSILRSQKEQGWLHHLHPTLARGHSKHDQCSPSHILVRIQIERGLDNLFHPGLFVAATQSLSPPPSLKMGEWTEIVKEVESKSGFLRREQTKSSLKGAGNIP